MQFWSVGQLEKSVTLNVSALRGQRTRQTILLHFLHSPTMSRAQGPILPLVKRPELFGWLYNCAAVRP
jgi:hypothetical protein